jgi:hypothetical protein
MTAPQAGPAGPDPEPAEPPAPRPTEPSPEPDRPAPDRPEQSREDTDAAWGEYPDHGDDRLYRDRPPHWDNY